MNAQVFEDNFNVLSQIINNYPTTNYTEGLNGSETDSSLGTSSQEHEKKPLTDSFKYYLLILFSSIYLIYVSNPVSKWPMLHGGAPVLRMVHSKFGIWCAGFTN